VLISDRTDKGRELAGCISIHYRCRAIGLYEDENALYRSAPVILIDIALRDGLAIGRLQYLLSLHRAPAAPVIAILRAGTRLERVQAAALGAIILLPADVSISAIAGALALTVGPAVPDISAEELTETSSIDKARLRFEILFSAVAQGKPIDEVLVDDVTGRVLVALAESNIRWWLDVVWTYDDATYRHCLLVTASRRHLRSISNFPKVISDNLRRALHDVGKAKIPLAILNKPAALTSEEMAVMRTHPRIGYDLLLGQQNYGLDILEVVLWHHELLDGSGYPDGLVGAQIPDLAGC
jgi:HD-GYP domain-containing protein (c-di-GMP phosphodiesterase class II)